MGFSLGKLLALPVRIVNIPLKLVDRVIDLEDEGDDITAAPLEYVAKELEEAVDGKD